MSCATMIESVKVERWCFIGVNLDTEEPLALAQFKISWVMPDGIPMSETKAFNGFDLLEMPRGAVPMMTPIYCLPHENHPGACTAALAYLIRTHDVENDLEDVEARIVVRGEERHDYDTEFWCIPPTEGGPNIYPLPIIDTWDEL